VWTIAGHKSESNMRQARERTSQIMMQIQLDLWLIQYPTDCSKSEKWPDSSI
jgi:hypothetical protein